MRALSIASTGMLAQQTNVEVIANNLANMNTTGFKLQRAEFQDLLYQTVQTPGSQTSDTGSVSPNGIQIGAGVKTAAVYRVTTQGDLKSTNNPYDVAIQGQGYFRIQMADGSDGFTRAGNFSLSPEGQLVTQQGLVVQPGIAIPQNTLQVQVNAQGQVMATVAGNAIPQTVGQLELTRFPNEAGSQCPGRQSLSGNAGLGCAPVGRAGLAGLRHHPAGLPRNLECQFGGRDHLADHGAARL
jgi:flagellar basal-body rod protein FlgG